MHPKNKDIKQLHPIDGQWSYETDRKRNDLTGSFQKILKPIEEVDEAKQRCNDNKKKKGRGGDRKQNHHHENRNGGEQQQYHSSNKPCKKTVITTSEKTVWTTNKEAAFKETKVMRPSKHRGKTLVESKRYASRIHMNTS